MEEDPLLEGAFLDPEDDEEDEKLDAEGFVKSLDPRRLTPLLKSVASGVAKVRDITSPDPRTSRASASFAEGALDAPLSLGAGVADVAGADETAEDIRRFNVTGAEDENLDQGAQTLGRIAGELGTTFAGGAGVGKAAGALGIKALQGGGLGAQAAKFAPVDFLFGLDEESSGLAAVEEATGANVSPENPILRGAAEAAAGGLIGAGADAAIRRLTKVPSSPGLDDAETVTEAAIKVGDDVHTGPNHPSIMVDIAGRDVDLESAVDGFVTSEGRFVTREEAHEIAARGGQLEEEEAAETLARGGAARSGGRLDASQTGRAPTDEELEEFVMESSDINARFDEPETADPFERGDPADFEEFDPAGEVPEGEFGRTVAESAEETVARAEAGATFPEIVHAVTRSAMGGILGGGVGSTVDAFIGDDESQAEGAVLGALAGAGFGLAEPAIVRAATDHLEDAQSSTFRQVAEADEARLNELIGNEPGLNNIDGRAPMEVDGVSEAVRKVIPKNIDAETIIRRGLAKLKTPTFRRKRDAIKRLHRLAQEGRFDSDRVPVAEIKKRAQEAGLDPETLDKTVGTLTAEERMAILGSMDDTGRLLSETQALMEKVRGQVPEEDWNKLLDYHQSLDEWHQQLAERVFREDSEIGRQLRMLQERAPRLDGEEANLARWELRARKLAEDNFDSNDRARLLKILNDQDEDEMMRFLQEMRGRGMNWGEKAAAFIKGGLLTKPATDLINLGSTMTHMAMRRVSDPVSAGADRMMKLMTGRRTKSAVLPGGRVEGLEFAQIDDKTGEVVLDAKRLRGAAKAAVDRLKRGGGEDMVRKLDFRDWRTGNALADGFFTYAFRRLGAEDAAMKGMAFATSLQERANVAAMRAGLEPGTDAFKSYVNRLISEQPDDLVMRAWGDAETATFTNRSEVGEAVNAFKTRLKDSSGTGALIAELGIPFVNTLINVADSMFKFSPLGALRPQTAGNAAKFVSMVMRGNGKNVPPAVQRQLAEAFGQAATGTALAGALGYHLRSQGAMTGFWPNDRDSNVFQQSNLQPLAIKLGDHTVSVENLSPFGNVMALGAHLHDLIENPQIDGIEYATGMVSGAFKQLGELTFLANATTLAQAVTQPERSGRALENLARMVVPFSALSGAAARTADPTLRRIDGPVESFMSGVPGLSDNLEPKIERSSGEPQVRDPSNFFQEVINPFRTEKINQDPVVKELSSLGVGIPDNTTPERRGATGEHLTELKSIYGRRLHDALERFMSRAEYDELTKPQKAEQLRSLIQRTRTSTTDALEEMGMMQDPGAGDGDPLLEGVFGAEQEATDDPFFQNLEGREESDPLLEGVF